MAMTAPLVLIVEDEATQLRILESVVSRAGYRVCTAMRGADALAKVDADSPPDVVLLDLMLPDMTGIDVLKTVRPAHPDLPVVMLTAKSSITTVVDAMRTGATDFLVKPASAERIRASLAAALNTASLVGEIAAMEDGGTRPGLAGLIGDSPAMTAAKTLAEKAAGTAIPVLIEGESGVGKEVFARAIHAAGDRAGGPFVAVNCGAIPENLVESILFGHEKGAFTGATEKRRGKFVEASGGTLFLDEVGELPLEIQVKLLRALQEQEIDPVGSRDSVKVDIRVISATNRHLYDLVATGAFREDLYYRLNVFPITLPPLRERREDIPALVRHFLARIADMEDVGLKSAGRDVIALLQHYDWPGNIRQLQNALFRAVILSDGTRLGPDDFPHMGDRTTQTQAPGALSPASRPLAGTWPGRAGQDGAPASRPADAHLSLVDPNGDFLPLAELEARILAAAIEKYQGRLAEVARRLKIGRSTLYRKVADYGLETDVRDGRR
ncbi:sigma-54-dependent transcriptional regulator [Eilatimonas milleporae]|uniref:DNA-binding transcriptional regulator NtrC n=1 Tax=Eilatimonas milleporae TaxID=911205 RepID=A0A3M0CH38_9PROT|nr:sigma-54 dependent transcriptional regulator [Eilatimonas milleporae]RMB07830.1 DNA-binding NtrC family response regulator [Eilatimonas milleporae]